MLYRSRRLAKTSDVVSASRPVRVSSAHRNKLRIEFDRNRSGCRRTSSHLLPAPQEMQHHSSVVSYLTRAAHIARSGGKGIRTPGSSRTIQGPPTAITDNCRLVRFSNSLATTLGSTSRDAPLGARPLVIITTGNTLASASTMRSIAQPTPPEEMQRIRRSAPPSDAWPKQRYR